MRYFEDVEVGVTTEFENTYTVTEDEIIEMGERFDPQYFHVDKEKAKSSMFGGLVASSVHLFAMMVAIGTKDTSTEPVAAVSALGFDKMRTRAPARPGDVLKVRSTFKEKRLSQSKKGFGIITAENEMYNQDQVVVMSFDHSFLVQCLPEDG